MSAATMTIGPCQDARQPQQVDPREYRPGLARFRNLRIFADGAQLHQLPLRDSLVLLEMLLLP